MNAKILMSVSALFMAILGVAASFFPQEILAYLGAPPEGREVLVVEIAGALYLGFAVLNWMARGNLIGGIYSRPVALGNFLHFLMVAITLGRSFATSAQRPMDLLVGTIAYTSFALCFGLILFTTPAEVTHSE